MKSDTARNSWAIRGGHRRRSGARLLSTGVLLALLAGCQPGEQQAMTRSDNEPGSTLRVAGIVLKWITADKDTNYARAEPLIREAAARGAELVITTECYLDGYAIRDKAIPIEDWRALGEPIPGGRYFERHCKLADELDIYLVAGMVEREDDKTCNTAVLLGPDGDLLGKYRKRELGHEAPRNTPGDRSPVFGTPFGKVGLMICADRRYPEIIRELGENGADIMVCPSGGMWGPVKNDHHLQARSRENRAPIIFVHPIEFLVTGSDGAILDRRFVGEDMSLEPDQIDGPRDSRLVALFDLPLE